MAQFNEILVGRYNRALQKLFGMKGQASVTALASEIYPSIPMFYGEENRYLEGWDIFGFGQTVNAVAAVNSAVRLRNPAGSNVIAVITLWTATDTGGSDTMLGSFGVLNTDLPGGVGQIQNFDSRGRLRASCIGSSGTNAAQVPGGTLQRAALTSTEVNFCLGIEIPLLPGSCVQVTSNNALVNLVVSMIWRERFLEESERA